MNKHAKYCLIAVCGLVAAILAGLFASARFYLVGAVCAIWGMYHLVQWLSRTSEEAEPTHDDVFRSFYGDDSEQSRDTKG